MVKNRLYIVRCGSGSEYMKCSIIRDYAIAHPDENIYINAINSYFAQTVAEELENVQAVDTSELAPLFNQIMNEKEEWDVKYDEVYQTYKFMTRQDNFYDAYRELIGMERKNDWSEKGSKYLPHLIIPQQIEEEAKKFADEHKKFIIFQRSGGINPVTPPQERMNILQQGEHGLKRSYPVNFSEKVVEGLQARGYEVLQYCLPEEVHIKGCMYLQQEQNQLLYSALAKYASGIVCIDSSLMHLTIYDCKHMTVMWAQSASGLNDCRGFGYEKADNLFAHNYRPLSVYFAGIPDSPVVNMATPNEVLASVDNWKKK